MAGRSRGEERSREGVAYHEDVGAPVAVVIRKRRKHADHVVGGDGATSHLLESPLAEATVELVGPSIGDEHIEVTVGVEIGEGHSLAPRPVATVRGTRAQKERVVLAPVGT